MAGPGGEVPDDQLVVAVRIGDAALFERVAALLADVPGLRLVTDGEQADLLLATAASLIERWLMAAHWPKRPVAAALPGVTQAWRRAGTSRPPWA